ncbi:hypothetical protein SCA6_007420 [Theobroma cacao]
MILFPVSIGEIFAPPIIQNIFLKASNMAVDDYEAKFNRLSKFVIYLAFDYESRARRFENDLNAHICKALAPLHLASYDELVGRAFLNFNLLKSVKLLILLRIDYLLRKLNCTMAKRPNKGSVQCMVEDIKLLNVSALLVLALDVANRAIILLIVFSSLKNLNQCRGHKILKLLKLQCKEPNPLMLFRLH